MTTPAGQGDTAPRRAPAWRTWAGRFGAILFGILAAWLLAEGLLRAAARLELLPVGLHETLTDVHLVPWSDETISPPKLVRTDSYFGSISRPADHYRWQVGGGAAVIDITTINWLDRNSYIGFRVPTTAWEPRWPVDVEVVGDSFSFCYTQYPDCWVERLETEHGLSVVNLGLPATGSVSHLRVLDTFGLPYKPRIVVWQWWGNDSFEDRLLETIANPKPGTGEALGLCANTPPFEQWLNRYSAISGMAHEIRCGLNPEAVDPYDVTSGQVRLVFGSPWFEAALDMSSKDNRRGWPMTRQAILDARKLAEENESAFVIVLIPAREEVYRTLTEPYLGADGVALFGEGRRMMLDLCQEEGLTCLDALRALERHANQGEQVYWPSDIHLNPAGNEVLAGAVVDFLRSQGLIP